MINYDEKHSDEEGERELTDYVGMYVKNGKTNMVEFPGKTKVFGGSKEHKDILPNRLDNPNQMKCVVFG